MKLGLYAFSDTPSLDLNKPDQVSYFFDLFVRILAITDRYTYIHRYLPTHLPTYLQTDRQAGRQAGRQTGRQA